MSNNLKRNDKIKNKPMNLPNRLSLARIVIVPIILLFLLFPYEQFNIIVPAFTFGFVDVSVVNVIVFCLFVFASFTDWLDGFLARRLKLITSFGKFIDPIADKLLTTTLLLVYMWQGIIPVLPVVLMVWRDIIIDGVRMISAEKGRVMGAGLLGKIKTGSQMAAIILITINNLPFELIQIPAASILLWFATFISVFSGISYVFQAGDIIMESK